MTDQQVPMPGDPPMRASNHDREQVATALQRAMAEGRISIAELEARLDSVYAAKTVADLEPVIRDLPAHQVSLAKSPSTAVGARGLSVSIGGDPGKANLVAVMSGVERRGTWVAPAHINAVAIMGGVVLDFTQATLTSMETVINVTAIMGGVDITVPAGMTVIASGVGIMGGFVDRTSQRYGPEAPVLRIKGVALMGGVEVKTDKRAIER